jgi:hypothetical protein
MPWTIHDISAAPEDDKVEGDEGVNASIDTKPQKRGDMEVSLSAAMLDVWP